MSTRITLAYIELGDTAVHVYKDMMDDWMHVAIGDIEISMPLQIWNRIVEVGKYKRDDGTIRPLKDDEKEID